MPSASFARGFEPQTVVTTFGKVISGVIRGESNEMITLYTSERREIRIARSDIEHIVPSRVSIMPQGLERSLTSDDMRDLLAWLTSLKDAKQQRDSR
jgi:putative heme-binding domain-containing protein